MITFASDISEEKTRKTFSKSFLSGVSGAALLLGAAYGTARAGPTITSSVGSVTITGASTVSVNDFIIIDADGVVSGNLTNTGTLGLPGPTAQPLVVRNGGIVTGNVVNTTSAVISASATGLGVTATGIAVLNATIGGVINNKGQINVANAFGLAAGIRITGT